jgi:5-methylcytosine-specific restriction endonuclease McrA
MLTLKNCVTCGHPKPLGDFGRRATSRDGRQGSCLTCTRKYYAKYYDAHFSKHHPPGDRPAHMRRKSRAHKELINPLRGVPCTDCGGSFPSPCMEFDHVQGEKRHNVAKMGSWKHETVLTEIQKCEVVCACCHRVRTASRRPVAVLPNVALPRWKYNKALRQQEKMAAFRSELLEWKRSPCTDCGLTFHPVAMDFDHVRGQKLFSISDGWHRTREEVLQELSKCDLVCANCHRLRTIQRQQPKAA